MELALEVELEAAALADEVEVELAAFEVDEAELELLVDAATLEELEPGLAVDEEEAVEELEEVVDADCPLVMAIADSSPLMQTKRRKMVREGPMDWRRW